MKTEDIPLNGPSDWRREPSERRNAILGKMAEETSELAARCVRSMIQGLDELDPDTGRSNLAHIEDEMADVEAMLSLVKVFLGVDREGISVRAGRKYNYKRPWIEALPDDH